MAIRPIRLLGDPVLRAQCKPVRFPMTYGDKKLIVDLYDTLQDFRKRHGFGRGIAAPQIGIAKRIIFIDSIGAMINPRIVKRSKTKFTLWDDCFSFPDLLVKVQRNRSVVVQYDNENGEPQRVSIRDDMSELLQHEIDHLNGVLAVDRAVDTKSIVLRSEYLKFFKKRK
ncbi:MAG: peptide deformylase [Ignavibacteriales bacterium]|nr:peptide deformylase [Ignavibacteriales bacterium]